MFHVIIYAFLLLLSLFTLCYWKVTNSIMCQQPTIYWLIVDIVTLLVIYFFTEAQSQCLLFCFLDLLVNALNYYLIYSGFDYSIPSPLPIDQSPRRAEYLIFSAKFVLYVFSLRIQFYSKDGLFFLIESFVDVVAVVALLYYLYFYMKSKGVVAPTLSETFIGEHKIGDFIIVYELIRLSFQVILICLHIIVIENLSQTNVAIFVLNSLSGSGVNILFGKLIFVFDTSSRKVQLVSPSEGFYQSSTHMGLFFLFLFLKGVVNYDYLSVHTMPLMIVICYFVFYYRITDRAIKLKLKEFMNKALITMTCQRNREILFKQNKKNFYQQMFIVNVTCLIYEMIFLIVFTNYTTPAVWEPNFIVRLLIQLATKIFY